MREKLYDNVAELYDFVTDNPVRRFLLPISKLAKKYSAKSILEIGCGTGRLSLALAEKGFAVTGIDSSKQMLEKAKQNSVFSENPVFLKKNICGFSFLKKFDLAIGIDCINHLLSEKELLKAFKCVRKSLGKKGLFLFDVLTENYAIKMASSNGFGETLGEQAFVWEDYFFLDYYFISFTVFSRKKGRLFERKKIEIVQRIYPRETIELLLKKAGFRKVKVFSSPKLSRVGRKPKELVFIAEK